MRAGLPLVVTTHRDPSLLVQRNGRPAASVARKSWTFFAKSIFAYRPGDQTGSWRASVRPEMPSTSISIS
jgi:hypothetical protein